MEDESRFIPGSSITIDRIQWAVLTALLALPPDANPGLRTLLASSMRGVRHDPPAPLTGAVAVDGFACGVDFLDAAVMRSDRDEHASADGRDMRFFATAQQGRLTAYYSQRRCIIRCPELPGSPEHGMPALPIMLLARMAVALPFHGAGLGSALLRDAIIRAAAESDVRLFYVHALSPAVKRFYQRYGFRPMPAVIDPLGMFVTLDDVGEIARTGVNRRADALANRCTADA